MPRESEFRESNTPPGSVTRNIANLDSDRAEVRERAAEMIWQRFVGEMMTVVRYRLSSGLKRREDENDVVQQVFADFFSRHVDGKFSLENRNQLRQLLTVIARARVCDVAQRHTAAKRDVSKEASDTHDTPIQAYQPTPDETVAMADELDYLMESLDDGQRQIAIWRMEGQTFEAIGQRLGLGKHAVMKRVAGIRQRWSNVLGNQRDGE